MNRCPHCEIAFASHSELVLHTQAAHKQQPTPEPPSGNVNVNSTSETRLFQVIEISSSEDGGVIMTIMKPQVRGKRVFLPLHM